MYRVGRWKELFCRFNRYQLIQLLGENFDRLVAFGVGRNYFSQVNWQSDVPILEKAKIFLNFKFNVFDLFEHY